MPIINNLSGNEIEILKLADFLMGVEHDITDVYFGELQVFTVWAETEGTLPLTINANGEPLIDWKIYGNTVQVSGTTTYPVISVTVQALESGTNYAMFNLADFPDVVAGDKITVNVGGTNYTLAVKKVDSTYVYVENREV